MKHSIGAITAAIGLAVASSTTAFAFGSDNKSEKVKLDELPPAVQNTINQHAEGQKVKRIERTTENGQTFYQVSIKGQKEELKIGSDGQFLGPQTSDQNHQNVSSPGTSPGSAQPMGTRGGQGSEPQR